MPVTTIKKSITKGEELVVLPRKEYDNLVSSKTEKSNLDKELLKALKEVRLGKIIGPFNSVKKLQESLEK